METTTNNAPDTAARWTLDASHSSVSFSVRHMMITNVRGEFQKVEGDVVFDPKNLGASRVNATIDVASIQTREPKRDEHLRSADFFDAAQFPAITFASRRVRKSGDGYEVVGDLTIRGTTREVTLGVEEVTAEHTDPYGNRRIGAAASAKIRRSEFGITWNAALEAGGVLVGDEIKIHLDVSLVRNA